MVLRIHYQKRSLVANISQSKEKVWALSILYDASRALQLPFCPSLKAQDAVVGASNHPVDEGVGHAPARTMHRIGRLVDRLIGAYGAMISRASKPHWFQPNSSHAVVIKALESQASSEALARRLWASLVREGQNTLVLDDFLRTFGSDRGKDADRCFRTFDENRNGDLLQDEMVMAVAEVGRMRRANIQGLDDMDYAMRSFDYMLQTVVALVVMLWVVIEYAPIAKNVIDVFQYAVVGVSFAMGRTVHEFVACSMYIFLKHPYDVGDRVELWNLHTNSLIPLVVQRVSLLYTVFKRVDNYKLFQSSNFVLNALSLENISRSGANKEQISFVVDFDTTFKDLSQLRDELQAFVSHPENRRDYNPDITVDIAGIHEMASLELRVELQYKTNWSNGPLRIARRAKFMCALVAIARRIPIARPGGYFPAGTEKNPQYVVQVSETQAGIQRGVIDRELREMRGDFSPETDGNEGGKKEEEAWWEAETQPSERSTTTIGAPDSEEAAAMLSMMGNLILPAPSLENPPRIGMTLQRRKKSGPVSLGGMSTSINTETTSA
ncbi:MAG: hypothetical protein M1838_004762 [Thelocarpon superellum]|nr:MAG: hypothetical protein M1838_004762 [Thelocarpon superellum]